MREDGWLGGEDDLGAGEESSFWGAFWEEDEAAASSADAEIEMPPDYVGQAGADSANFEIEMPPDPLTPSAAARIAAEDAQAQAAGWDATFDAVDAAYTNARMAADDARDAVAKADDDNVLDAIDRAEAAEAAAYSISDVHMATKHVADDAADAAALANAAAEAASAIDDAYGEAVAIEAEDWF